jgi:sugar phosphate isomerase/epimerase
MHLCLHRGTAGGNLPLEDFVALSAANGFAGADVCLDYAVQRSPAALRDLYASKHHQFGGWGLPFDWRADASKQPEGLKKLEAHAKVAAELKIDSCGTWIMPSSTLPFIDNWNFHVQRLKPAAQRLADAGLRLALEFIGPHHHRRRHPHEFIFTAGQMLELADAIGPNAGLLVDSYHVYTSGEPFDRLATLPGKRIPWVHINDAPNLPVAQQKDSERALPGEGILDLKAFLAALNQAGYTGPVSLEVFSPALKKLPAADAAKKAGEACRKALHELLGH